MAMITNYLQQHTYIIMSICAHTHTFTLILTLSAAATWSGNIRLPLGPTKDSNLLRISSWAICSSVSGTTTSFARFCCFDTAGARHAAGRAAAPA